MTNPYDELESMNRWLRQYVLIACGVILTLSAMACGTAGYVVYAIVNAITGSN